MNYISKCCGAQIEPGGYQDTGYVCRKCGNECEVTPVLDTPNGVPKGEILKSLKEDAMLDEAIASVELSKDPECQTVTEEDLKPTANEDEISNRLAVPKVREEIAESFEREMYDLFENSGWSGVLNTLGHRSKAEVIGVILNQLDESLTQRTAEIINDIGSNPNADGSTSPNIQYHLEQLQSMLKRKYLS